MALFCFQDFTPAAKPTLIKTIINYPFKKKIFKIFKKKKAIINYPFKSLPSWRIWIYLDLGWTSERERERKQNWVAKRKRSWVNGGILNFWGSDIFREKWEGSFQFLVVKICVGTGILWCCKWYFCPSLNSPSGPCGWITIQDCVKSMC